MSSALPSSRRTATRPAVGALRGAEARQHLAHPLDLRLVARGRLDRRPADLRLERVGRALGDDLAGVDDPDPVGERVGLLEVLRGQEDGHALVAGEPRDLVPERGAALHVEAGGGLVEEEDAGLVDQRQREVEPPAHAAGVAADLAVGRLGEPDALDQLVAAAQRLVLRRSRASRACRRMCSRAVRNWSSAASWSATPIGRERRALA